MNQFGWYMASNGVIMVDDDGKYLLAMDNDNGWWWWNIWLVIMVDQPNLWFIMVDDGHNS